MLTNTTDLMKFKRLQRRLSLRLYEAMGILEALWRATVINAKQGDIGKLTNEEIATAVDWGGNEDDLISALADCGWLDRHPKYRLLVHDWKDHCPKFVRAVLAKKKLPILTLDDNPELPTQGCELNELSCELNAFSNEPKVDNPKLPTLSCQPTGIGAGIGAGCSRGSRQPKQAGPDGTTTSSLNFYQSKAPATIYAELTGEVLPEPQARWLYQKLGGDDPEVMERWRKVVEGSMGFTWGKGRLNACFDHFQRGEIPGGGQSQAKARVESGSGEGDHYPDPFAGMSEAEIRAKHARFMRVREIGLAAVLAEEEAAEEGQKALEPP